MNPEDFTAEERATVHRLLEFHRSQSRYVAHSRSTILSLISDSDELADLIHSYSVRLKTESSLQDKLFRKIRDAKEQGKPFEITELNFYKKITDTVGARLLHLSLTQFAAIDAELKRSFQIAGLILLEQPFARVIDAETAQLFEQLGFSVEPNPGLYASVHYVVAPNSLVPWSAELQVRTLSQEVWGEVDHLFNYPHCHPDEGCREQIKTLAHQMNTATRAVDAIFRSVEAYNRAKGEQGER